MTNIGGFDFDKASVCACLGPQFGEPECPCAMNRLGLPPSQERLDYIAYQNTDEYKAEQEVMLGELKKMFECVKPQTEETIVLLG